MARRSPISELHEHAGALTALFGPPEAAIDVVVAYDFLETEYATLRKAAVMLDHPQRGTLEVRGADRIAFLNRMVTHELKGLEAFQVRRSFWLSRKGRIDADVRLIELPDRMLIDLDAHAAAPMGDRKAAAETLMQYVFSEEVTIEDQGEAWHRLSLHGPAAMAVLAANSSQVAGPLLADLASLQACIVRIGACEVIVDRDDSAGEIGLELLMRVGDARAVYEALSEPPDTRSREEGQGYQGGMTAATKARRVGWHAYNIARIEAGTPKYYIDFGPTSLPHETGVLRERISFKKGCYLGQEVVARMESLGHPKQRLVALRLADAKVAPVGDGTASQEDDLTPRLPMTGSGVFAMPAGEGASAGQPGGELVGAVTSSTISPMLSGQPVCFAMVKYKHSEPGTRLEVEAGENAAERVVGTVQKELAFWRR